LRALGRALGWALRSSCLVLVVLLLLVVPIPMAPLFRVFLTPERRNHAALVVRQEKR
jgi:hypothetical protein